MTINKELIIPADVAEDFRRDTAPDADLRKLKKKYQSKELPVWSVDFGNGMEMDVKLCCGDVVTAEENPLWTEAVLFLNGYEVACTDGYSTLRPYYELHHGDTAYRVTVRVEGEKPTKSYTDRMVDWLESVPDGQRVEVYDRNSGVYLRTLERFRINKETRQLVGGNPLAAYGLDDIIAVRKLGPEPDTDDVWRVPFTYGRHGYIKVHGPLSSARRKAKGILSTMTIEEMEQVSGFQSASARIEMDEEILDAYGRPVKE